MKNIYATPEIEVVKVDSLETLTVSIGDIDVNIENGFF